MSILLLVLGLIMFVGLVVVHELGHFLAARRNGVEVEEFGIGFPPAFWRKRIKSPKGDYDFTLNLLPLGGFVRLKGEHDSDTEKGTFGVAPLLAKSKIMIAGVVMNLLTAFVLLFIGALIGLPQIVDNQFSVNSDAHTIKQAQVSVLVNEVGVDSPAAKAGLQSGDQITGLGPVGEVQPVLDTGSLQRLSKYFEGRDVNVTYVRDGQTDTVATKLNTTTAVDASRQTSQPTGYLGVGLDTKTDGLTMIRYTWSAPVVAAGLIGQFTALTFQGLGHALAGVGSILAGVVSGNNTARVAGQAAASDQVSGPVGIFVVLKEGSALGFQFTLFIMAIISLSLAVMNILPIPALDGGRLWFTLAARLFKKKISQKAEELTNGIGFVVLIGLMILISVVDVKRFF